MGRVYGVAIRKGGQGKSTTVSTLARLCALYGARVLVVDLAQPGTTSLSLRDIWPEGTHGELSAALLNLQLVPAGTTPDAAQAAETLHALELPVSLKAQPSWSGGHIRVLPWDDLQADAAAFLHSERVLAGLIASQASETDLVLIDFPAESGPLVTNALLATDRIIMPLVPETPALEGLEAMLRQMARVRETGHPIDLAGILLTRCEPRNKRAIEIAQTLMQSGEVEGVPVGRKLFPFAIRNSDFFEQAFRYGEPVWERGPNPLWWASYVLLAEWVLRDAGRPDLAATRRGPALQLAPDTRILDTTALMLEGGEVRLDDFEKAHGFRRG
jgi:chromosome partitioning protein